MMSGEKEKHWLWELCRAPTLAMGIMQSANGRR